MFWKIVPGLTRLPSGSLAADVSARSIPSVSWIGSSDRQSTACSRLRVMVEVLRDRAGQPDGPVPAGQRRGHRVDAHRHPGFGWLRRRPRGAGSHRPQTRTAAANSARAARFGDPLLTGSSYSQRCARPGFSGALRPVAPLQWTNVSRTDRLSRAQANAVAELVRVAPVVDRLGALFGAAGHRLYLVGGSVRDALLGRLGHDLDFTTDARPDTIERLLRQLTPAVWTIGKDFGTIGGRITAGQATWVVEITTFRADVYADHSRKPSVVFGDTLDEDLVRRDFTVNAMAVDVDGLAFVDPYGGLEALAAGSLDTPATPEQSFSDDPLRMLRAARFRTTAWAAGPGPVVVPARRRSRR